MTRLEQLHQEVRQTREQYEQAAAVFRQAVAAELAAGVRAVEIAETLGVTRSRVYQWARES
jgi:transposase